MFAYLKEHVRLVSFKNDTHQFEEIWQQIFEWLSYLLC